MTPTQGNSLVGAFTLVHLQRNIDVHDSVYRACANAGIDYTDSERELDVLSIGSESACSFPPIKEVFAESGFARGYYYWEPNPHVKAALLNENCGQLPETTVQLLSSLYGQEISAPFLQLFLDALEEEELELQPVSYAYYPKKSFDLVIGSMLPSRAILEGGIKAGAFLSHHAALLNPGGVLSVGTIFPYIDDLSDEERRLSGNDFTGSDLFFHFMTRILPDAIERYAVDNGPVPTINEPSTLSGHYLIEGMPDNLEIVSVRLDRHEGGTAKDVLLGLGFFAVIDALGIENITPEVATLINAACQEALAKYPEDAQAVPSVSGKTWVFRKKA